MADHAARNVIEMMKPAEATANDAKPRYRQLARDLSAAIHRGDYPVGSQLPTELQLCAQHGVSRYTAREALRMLRDAGLINRRRGAGSIVTSREIRPALVQPLGGFKQLVQYARTAHLYVTACRKVRVDEQLARSTGLTAGDDYVLVTGLRRIGLHTPPISLVEIYLRGDLAPSEDKIRTCRGAVLLLIHKEFGVMPTRIEQEISACQLTREQAAELADRKGAPALCTVRRYYGADGRLIAVAKAYNPGGRLVYALTSQGESIEKLEEII